ncbi:MAG: class I SAM-dependent methyltransferase [Deltaproteobacteria bacterium]|nr:class I SAM-dependent methyltransferase [Deltaproteobacteria bacterium]
MTVDDSLRQVEALYAACQSDPGQWNILRAEQEWALYGDACDPLSPSAPERALKALQREIYLDVWGAALAGVPSAARVMVAGGGTGRFAQVLAQRGWRVELVDASPHAVRRARHHLGAAVAATVGDLARPETLAAQAYDLVLAVEVPCYATDPALMMRHLHAALRPGGTLLFSVEARPGALLADRDLASPEAARAVLDHGVITLPGLKHVHYYTRAEAGALATQAGLTVLGVEGVCYVPDGPFGAMVDAARLDDPTHAEQLTAVERRCREDPVLRELPRAWAVHARR